MIVIHRCVYSPASEGALQLSSTPMLFSFPPMLQSHRQVLALHLMCERRKGENSFWKDYIRYGKDQWEPRVLQQSLSGREDECWDSRTIVNTCFFPRLLSLNVASRTLPDDVDTPVKWTVEGADEVRLLEGTMVGLLTRMMCSQVHSTFVATLCDRDGMCDVDCVAIPCLRHMFRSSVVRVLMTEEGTESVQSLVCVQVVSAFCT